MFVEINNNPVFNFNYHHRIINNYTMMILDKYFAIIYKNIIDKTPKQNRTSLATVP